MLMLVLVSVLVMVGRYTLGYGGGFLVALLVLELDGGADGVDGEACESLAAVTAVVVVAVAAAAAAVGVSVAGGVEAGGEWASHGEGPGVFATAAHCELGWWADVG